MSAPERKLVRVQEKGQVTIPVELRRKLGVKKGDYVAMIDAGSGVVITRQEVLASTALAQMGEILRQHGVSLTELMESGQKIRGELAEELYGLVAGDEES